MTRSRSEIEEQLHMNTSKSTAEDKMWQLSPK